MNAAELVSAKLVLARLVFTRLVSAELVSAMLFQALIETTLATSVAALLVLFSRSRVRRLAGSRVVYALWAMVPCAALAVLLPGPVRRVVLEADAVRHAAGIATAAMPVVDPGASEGAMAWLAAWGSGVLVALLVLAWRQRSFVRGLGDVHPRGDGLWQADAVVGLPAVMGLRPRIVLPADFERRYSEQERCLIVAHESLHLRRGDLPVNAFAAALRCLYWFNPLLYLAFDRFRRDQELACDAGVVARHPGSRRAYAEAMLKTGLAGLPAPLACQWPGQHPLKQRIAMLSRPHPTRCQRIAGTVLALGLTTACVYGTWAVPSSAQQQPAAVGQASATNRPASDPVSVEFAQAPARAIAAELARQAGLRFDGAMPRAGHALTMVLHDAPLASALRLLADQTGSIAVLQGGRLSFVPKGQGLLAGMRVSAAPKYPAAAAKAGISGKVLLLVDIDAVGNVTHAAVKMATPPGVFEAVTLEAVKQWKFEPRSQGGKAVPARVRVPVTFEADRGPGGGKGKGGA